MYKQDKNFSLSNGTLAKKKYPANVANFGVADIDCLENQQKTTLLIDFDGTICYQDVTDFLLNKFALPGFEELEELWISGAIGARECMAKQIALIRATPQELDNALDSVEIDVAFKPFLDMVTKQGDQGQQVSAQQVSAQVVSDGLDYSIKHILKRAGITDLPVFSNHLVYLGDKKWQLHFPLKANNCPSGHCKCRRYDALPFVRTIYIGDGTSDFCPSKKADFVLAKGKLADHCEKHSIAHARIDNFSQIMALWPDLERRYGAVQAQKAARIAS